jgi:hypothetical protein
VRACALFLFAALCALVPLAEAIPPDPSWIPGIYDAEDFDDHVVLATGTVAAVEHDIVVIVKSALIAAEHLGLSAADPLRSAVLRTSYGRAPPA